MSRSALLLLLGGAFLLVVGSACIARSQPDDLERRAQALESTLMCPVCPGQTIRESQVELAKQMRALIREKLREGWTEEQIRQFLVERYGARVLAEPPARDFSLLVWVIPPVALAIGALLVALVVRSLSRPSGEDAPEEEDGDLAPYLALADAEARAVAGEATQPEGDSDKEANGP